MKNGALLNAAEEAGFDLFITADQEVKVTKQNLSGLKMALLVLSTNNIMAATECCARHLCREIPWRGFDLIVIIDITN